MTSIKHEKIEAMAGKAKLIRDACLREREMERAVQISANAEVRRGGRDSDKRNKATSVNMPHGLSQGDKRELRRSPTWSQWVSNRITQHVRAVASRLQIDQPESIAYVMNRLHRIATGDQKEIPS